MPNCSQPQPSAGWSERFDKTFFQDSTGEKCDGWLAARGSLLYNGVDDGYCKIANPNDLKAFIATELQAAREEERVYILEVAKAYMNEVDYENFLVGL